jgi:DNA-binding PadR family transcriptional regulator
LDVYGGSEDGHVVLSDRQPWEIASQPNLFFPSGGSAGIHTEMTERNPYSHRPSVETQILQSLAREPLDAYAANIQRRIGSKYILNVALSRLVDKGWVTPNGWSDPVAEPGGRACKLYQITPLGRQVLQTRALATSNKETSDGQ